MNSKQTFLIFWVIVSVVFLGYVTSTYALVPKIDQGIDSTTGKPYYFGEIGTWQRPMYFNDKGVLLSVDSIKFRVNSDVSRIRVSREMSETISMFPTMVGGEKLISLDNPQKSELNVGDIILYWNADKMLLVCHRVIEIGEDSDGWFVLTKGDNNQNADAPVRFNQIKSKVVGVLY